MTLDLQRLRAMMEAATPAPWCVSSHREQYWNVADMAANHLFQGWREEQNDVQFVVELRNAAPALLRAAERAERMESALRFCRDCLEPDEHEAREIIDEALKP